MINLSLENAQLVKNDWTIHCVISKIPVVFENCFNSPVYLLDFSLRCTI